MRPVLSAWSLAFALGLFASSSAFAGFTAPPTPVDPPPVVVDPCLSSSHDSDEYTSLMSYMSGRCGSSSDDESGHHHSRDRDRDRDRDYSRSRDRDGGRKGYSDRDGRHSGGDKRSGKRS